MTTDVVGSIAPMTQAASTNPETGALGGDPPEEAVFYASVGEELYRYKVDLAGASLTFCGTTVLPTPIQYAQASPARRCFYTTSSHRETGRHFLHAFRIDPREGELLPHGEPAVLPDRPIHFTLDQSAFHALVAFNKSATVEVYRLQENGEILGRVVQPARPAGGIYTHQVRVSPSGDTVIAVGRGNDPKDNRPEERGSLNLFGYRDGMLTKTGQIDYPAGLGPRHLDFHPTKPWVYVVLERGNKLYTYSLHDGVLKGNPLFCKETLADPGQAGRPRQLACAIHVAPTGKFLYVSNRYDGTVNDAPSGQKVYAGGENNIAVYAVDQETGEPTLIQHIDTHGITPRTFALDPSGRLLVVGNLRALSVREGDRLVQIPRSLAVFRVGADGKLEYARKYAVDSEKELFWTGFVKLERQKVNSGPQVC